MKGTTRRLGLEALEQRDTPSAAHIVPVIIFPARVEMENVLISSRVAVSQPAPAVTVATPDHTHAPSPVAAAARIGPILDFPGAMNSARIGPIIDTSWVMRYDLATSRGV